MNCDIRKKIEKAQNNVVEEKAKYDKVVNELTGKVSDETAEAG